VRHRNTADEVAGKREIAMGALIEFSRNTQRTLCMLMSVVIVVAVLGFNAYEAQALQHPGYSVTITQLQ
jgi:hypothetical protein